MYVRNPIRNRSKFHAWYGFDLWQLCTIHAHDQSNQYDFTFQMIELDPTNCKWYLNLYHPAEKLRRETVPFNRQMSESEIAAITAAFDCPGASFEPSVVIIYLQCLARVVHDARYPLQFGSVQFETPQEIVRYLRTQAE